MIVGLGSVNAPTADPQTFRRRCYRIQRGKDMAFPAVPINAPRKSGTVGYLPPFVYTCRQMKMVSHDALAVLLEAAVDGNPVGRRFPGGPDASLEWYDLGRVAEVGAKPHAGAVLGVALVHLQRSEGNLGARPPVVVARVARIAVKVNREVISICLWVQEYGLGRANFTRVSSGTSFAKEISAGFSKGERTMITPIHELPPTDPECGLLNVVIDSPKGSRNKYKLDEQIGQWRLSKVLPQGMYFPYDFGFLPSTTSEDGDPVDILLIADESTFPGCVIPARLIGVIEAEQTEDAKTIRNDRLIAVVETPYNPAEYRSLAEMSGQRLDEIEAFFVAYNRIEGRQFRPIGRSGAERAQVILDEFTRTKVGKNRNGSSRRHRSK